MTLHAVRPESERRLEGITVAKAASLLGCDDSTVRALIRCGALTGWRVGKTDRPGGVRCELQSVLDYRARHAISEPEAGPAGPAPRRRQKPSHAAYREALAEAKALGIRLPPR